MIFEKELKLNGKRKKKKIEKKQKEKEYI